MEVFRFELIHMHRFFNIFEIPITEVLIVEVGISRQLIEYSTRYSKAPGRFKLLDSCRNVNPISINIIAVMNDFSDIYSNSELD